MTEISQALRATALIGLLGLVACVPSQNPADPDEAPDINYEATSLKDSQFVGSIPAIDSEVLSRMAGRFPGCAIGIVANGEVKYVKTYGFADTNPMAPIPFGKAHVSGIGSVSKTLTATAIMRLVELGKVNLNAAIATYFPHQVPTSWNTITVHELLSHRAGLQRDPDSSLPGTLSPLQVDALFGQTHASQHPRYAVWEFLLTTAAVRKAALAGTHHYSNVGYTLLGAIIDWVTNDGTFVSEQRGYERFVWSLVVKAKGSYNQNAALTAVLDHYWRAGDIPYEAKSYNAAWGNFATNWSGWQAASGGWCMRISDLARFMAALGNGEIITPASLAQMRVNNSAVTEDAYGYGLYVANRLGRPCYAHGGVIDGYRCQFSVWPGENLGVVVFANRDAHGVGAIADAVAQLYLDGECVIEYSLQDRARMEQSDYQLWKHNWSGAESALNNWLRLYGTNGTRSRLIQSLSRDSQETRELLALILKDPRQRGRITELFLRAIKRGPVGPYRPRR